MKRVVLWLVIALIRRRVRADNPLEPVKRMEQEWPVLLDSPFPLDGPRTVARQRQVVNRW